MLTGDVFWLFFGILISLLVQVSYDLLGGIFEDKLLTHKIYAKFCSGVLTFALVGLVIGLIQAL